MGRQPENDLHAAIVGVFHDLGGRAWRIRPQGSAGWPDIYGLLPSAYDYAIPVHVEAKSHGKSPEPLQGHVMDKLRDAGAVAFWSDDAEDCRLALERLRGRA